MRGVSGVGGLVVALAALGLAMSAWAGNTQHPRTPVLWPDAPCIQTVDRSVDPELAFAYAIPAEDTQLSIDEFEDSRTHQFIGFCRQWPAGQPPPRYVSVYDLERAIAAGFEEVVELGDPEGTLETSVVWADCWTRITPDDARRAITHEAAAEPVVWDTSTLGDGGVGGDGTGTWMIAGYTWEPPLNLWSRTPWVVRVVDEAAPLEPVQAAATMADTDDSLYPDESLEIELCVDASAGSTVVLEWVSNKADPFAWTALSSAEVGGSGTEMLSLAFVPPEPSLGQTVLLRASVEQPEGPSYAAHALASVIVFTGGDGDGDGDTGGSTESGDTGESGDTSDDEPTSDTGDSATDSDTPRSGRCSVDPERGTLPGLWLLLGLVLLASRRSHPAHETLQ